VRIPHTDFHFAIVAFAVRDGNKEHRHSYRGKRRRRLIDRESNGRFATLAALSPTLSRLQKAKVLSIIGGITERRRGEARGSISLRYSPRE
jgi:hypothetical protein